MGPRPPRIKDTGVIIDLAVHDIDLIHYITEQVIVDVYCVSSSNFMLFEDAAAILLRTEGGVSGQLIVNWVTPYKMREIQLVTSNRLVRANLLTQHVRSASRYVSVGSKDQEDGSYLVNDLYIRYREPLKAQLAAFLEAIRRDEVPPVTGEDGLHALEIALRAATFKPASSLQSRRSVAV